MNFVLLKDRSRKYIELKPLAVLKLFPRGREPERSSRVEWEDRKVEKVAALDRQRR